MNILHPGESTTATNIGIPANFDSHWPSAVATDRPRSATIAITKSDGGLVGA